MFIIRTSKTKPNHTNEKKNVGSLPFLRLEGLSGPIITYSKYKIAHTIEFTFSNDGRGAFASYTISLRLNKAAIINIY